ncbi:S-layer homology domain-containing protein [Paenibacillus koleovorans]|uniref:S-layer homology domain-containing protein n=1 Tax=Paenibacillus koleovorans TaxID=121608 RepID=UPI000FD7D0E5|nr:S-layer homology domain-containing protein [Paenibacillus koleovorans]
MKNNGRTTRSSKITRLAIGFLLLWTALAGQPYFNVHKAVAAAEAQPVFTDLENAYAKQEIMALVQSGVLSGYDDGTFAPNRSLSRAELAKVLAKIMHLEEDLHAAAKFRDVPVDSWYAGYVGALVRSDVTNGTTEISFSPHATVSREELIVFFLRAWKMDQLASSSSAPLAYNDSAAISPWAEASIRVAAQIGIIQEKDNGLAKSSLAPTAPAERQFLARLAYEFSVHYELYREKAKSLIQRAPNLNPVLKPIEPLVLSTGGASKTYRGEDLASDPESTPLHISSATLDLPKHARIELSPDGVLTVHPMVSGYAKIMIKIADTDGGIVETEIKLTIKTGDNLPAETTVHTVGRSTRTPSFTLLATDIRTTPDYEGMYIESAKAATDGIAALSVENGALVIKPLAAGTTAITVSIRNKYGLNTYSFNLTLVEPDPSKQRPPVQSH